MTADTPIDLARRESDGIAVTLYWSRRDGAVTVLVEQRATESRFELEVEPARALEAFYHPFGYAAARAPELLDVAA